MPESGNFTSRTGKRYFQCDMRSPKSLNSFNPLDMIIMALTHPTSPQNASSVALMRNVTKMSSDLITTASSGKEPQWSSGMRTTQSRPKFLSRVMKAW